MGRSNKITKRSVSIDVSFYGTGAIQRRGGASSAACRTLRSVPIYSSSCGVKCRTRRGSGTPVIGEDTVDGGFQLSITGTSAGYREIARYLLAIAELDTSADPGFHDHHEVSSTDARTRLHIIVRKRPDNTQPHSPTRSITIGRT